MAQSPDPAAVRLARLLKQGQPRVVETERHLSPLPMALYDQLEAVIHDAVQGS